MKSVLFRIELLKRESRRQWIVDLLGFYQPYDKAESAEENK